jgi:outer membrane protein assembly factor BamB
MTPTVRNAMILSLFVALPGCGIFRGGDGKPKTPVLGERIPVLVSESGVEVDPALADVAIALPPPIANADWTQPGGNAAKSMGHPALAANPTRLWTASVKGSHQRARLAAAPVVANGRVYVMDTRGRVTAFDADSGREIWSKPVGDEKDVRGGMNFWTGEMTGNSGVVFGGGVSIDGDRLFATNGIGDVVAMNASDGAVIWKKRPGGPLRGAPTLAIGNVYVMSQDNQLFALRASDGNIEWTESATLEIAGVFGVAAPAVAQGTIVAGFSSGELNAYRYENGRALWQDALSRTSISTSVATLSDIDADPVIDQGRVYSVGQGGRMVALELVTGQRLWEINVAGISTPWVAGEWLFVVTDDARLLAISRATGRVRWVSQLKRWRDEKDRKGPISWTGPTLAGGRLIVASSRGHIAYVSPLTGAVEQTVDYGTAIDLPPVVANNTLYILDTKGRLTAWR